MNIGERIRIARLEKGLTQEELGQLLGVEKSAVAKYENGRVVNLKQATLTKLSEILEIPPSELIITQPSSCIAGTNKNKSIDSSREFFSKNLRLFMAKTGKSRKEVSEAIGVSYFTFSDWCNGKKYPRIEKLETLAKYFGVSVSELVGEQQAESVKIEPAKISKNDVLDIVIRLHTDKEFLKIVEKMSTLDSEKIKALKQFLLAFGE